MTEAQKKIVRNWYLITFLICVLTGISLSASDNKQLLNILIGSPIFIYVISRQDIGQQIGYGVNGLSLGKFIEENKILKLWLVLFCTFILPFIIYKLFIGSQISGWLYALAFILLLGPLFIASEIQRFKHAGKNA
ncbi:hypothetical protein [Methylobacter sp.]|uniref:hypothetical protein n=1 Tax=Methylobacter sp. TaxID=2051955 RepID=UPI00120ABAAA|nr:hypothetical protein [Methylobacter sp.]TAK63463.1 MAG: hypothetical protein EPO18_06695 [Methylobacter sp.]